MKYEKLKNYENIYIFLKYKTMYKRKNSNSDGKWIQKNKINSAKMRRDNVKNSLNRIKKKACNEYI